jgi:hypothetical protein
MFICGLIFIGAALVLLGAKLNPRRSDPMGIFGLPSVCAISCRAGNVRTRATGPADFDPRRGDREAA